MQQMKKWVDAWKIAGRALDRIKCEELRAMDERASAEAFRSLLHSNFPAYEHPECLNGAGLVEQQRIFSKGHDRANRP